MTTIPKTSILLPLRSVGPQLPRLDTAALGSQEQPRFGPRAASRGQGGRGCAGHLRPWPRTRILGETFMRQLDPCEEVDGMLIFQVFGGYCFQLLWRVSAKTFGTDILRFFSRLRFLHPFV